MLSLAVKPITLNVVVLSVVAQGRLADTRDSIQNPRADQRQTDQQGGQKIWKKIRPNFEKVAKTFFRPKNVKICTSTLNLKAQKRQHQTIFWKIKISVPMTKPFLRRQDIQHNDTQHNDIRHNDVQHSATRHKIWKNTTLIITTLTITALNTGRLSVFTLRVVNKAIKLNVDMLNAVAPF